MMYSNELNLDNVYNNDNHLIKNFIHMLDDFGYNYLLKGKLLNIKEEFIVCNSLKDVFSNS